jgi:steroid delta-isomerase-like uncharacterized protein
MTSTLTEALTVEEPVRIACEYVDALSGGEWGIMRATLASDARYDELGRDRSIEGAGTVVELFRRWKQAFPDATGTVASAFSSGDKVALEVTWEGTHTGPLATADGGLPPTRTQRVTPATFFFTFEGDKIKESRQHFDSLPFLQQIGAGAMTGATRGAGEGTASVPLLVNKEVLPMPVDLAAARSSFRRRFGAFIRRHLGARSFTGRRRSVFG